MDEARITDVEALKAVAHPLRTKMLAMLRYDGPATASELGRRVDESSGSTSYHLRVLAKYGFIEEDPEQPNKRDRRWRATRELTSWRHRDFAGDPEGRELSQALERRQILHAMEHFQHWHGIRDQLDPRWVDAGGSYDDLLRLTPSQLTRLQEEIFAVVARYKNDPPPADPAEPSAHVVLYAQYLPFEENPL